MSKKPKRTQAETDKILAAIEKVCRKHGKPKDRPIIDFIMELAAV